MSGNRARKFLFVVLVLVVSGHVSAEEQQDRAENDGAQVGEQSQLSINEPMYFVVGGSGDTKARFQLSLKYKIFDPDGAVAGPLPFLKALHFGYTQTSLWNLEADSRAFEDSSYRPGVFWEFSARRADLLPDFLRFGFEHESNGRDEEFTRSVNTLFVLPAWGLELFGRDLVLGTKLYTYLSLDDENSDIADYRGHADYVVRYGRETSAQLQVLYRRGRIGVNTWQLDFSLPIRQPVFARTGSYIYLQAFKGYGESLLVYDEPRDWQVRLGLAVVR
jgi:outer membrane phospholipase A